MYSSRILMTYTDETPLGFMSSRRMGQAHCSEDAQMLLEGPSMSCLVIGDVEQLRQRPCIMLYIKVVKKGVNGFVVGLN